jgi:hypothetical protein
MRKPPLENEWFGDIDSYRTFRDQDDEFCGTGRGLSHRDHNGRIVQPDCVDRGCPQPAHLILLAV